MPDKFILHSKFQPTRDQPEAIEKLTKGIENGLKEQVLLGGTGSGKTFTMANVIANINRPTLVLAQNKTLAAQLCSEFQEFFPENAVEYFVSYNNHRIKAKLKGLSPAIHRQQALSVAGTIFIRILCRTFWGPFKLLYCLFIFFKSTSVFLMWIFK